MCICTYLRMGGRKPAAARRVFLFLASRHTTHGRQLASQWRRGCGRASVMVMEGAEKQAGRLWDKFGMKEVYSEREVRYVVCWCRSSSQGNGMCLSHAGRYASYGSWKATSALAKGKYRLSSSGGIPRARAEDLLHSKRRRRARGARVRHAFEKKQCLECLKFAMHTAARRKAAFVDLEE